MKTLDFEELSKLDDWNLKVRITTALGLARVEEFELLRKIEKLEHLFVDAGVSLSHKDPQSFLDFKEVQENVQRVINEISTKIERFYWLNEAAERRFVDKDGVLIACDDAMTFQFLHLQGKVQGQSFISISHKAINIRKQMGRLLEAMTAQEEK